MSEFQFFVDGFGWKPVYGAVFGCSQRPWAIMVLLCYRYPYSVTLIISNFETIFHWIWISIEEKDHNSQPSLRTPISDFIPCNFVFRASTQSKMLGWTWKVVQSKSAWFMIDSTYNIFHISNYYFWKFGFSDFRNYSFSVSDFSFVYAYTKENMKTLKE